MSQIIWEGQPASWDGQAAFWEGGPVDETAPTVQGATIQTAGDSIVIRFSEPVVGSSGFGLSLSGGAASLTFVSAAFDELIYSISRVVTSNETGLLTYFGGDIEDLAGNPLQSFVLGITNNSLIGLPPVDPGDPGDPDDPNFPGEIEGKTVIRSSRKLDPIKTSPRSYRIGTR